VRVVLDANVFVGFCLAHSLILTKILELWQKKKILVYLSPEIKAEILRVFLYPKIKKYFNYQHFRVVKYLLNKQTMMVYPKKKIDICKDSFDNMYLECSQVSQAEFLITGDKKHLLSLENFGKTKIVSPAQFVKGLEK